MWRTQLGTNAVARAADPDAAWFQRVGSLSVEADGTVTFEAQADAVYTLSTITTAKKGVSAAPIPQPAPFPLPYFDSFDSVTPPRQALYFSDMEGAFEVVADVMIEDSGDHGDDAKTAKPSTTTGHGATATTRSGSSSSKSTPTTMAAQSNQVLVQASPRRDCCNFIPSLDGPLPLTIIGSSAWEHVVATVSVRLPVSEPSNPSAGGGSDDSFAAVAVRSQFAASSFFSGGLGLPTGLFLAVDSTRWVLLTSVAAMAAGLPLSCVAPPSGPCLASGTVTSGLPSRWHVLRLDVFNRTATVAVDGAAPEVVTLPDGVAQGGGYVALVSSFSSVAFDNFSVAASAALEVTGLLPSRCAVAPAAGQSLVSIGCGEGAAANGSNFVVEGGDGGAGRISLRSAPHLCLEVDNVAALPTAASSDADTRSSAAVLREGSSAPRVRSGNAIKPPNKDKRNVPTILQSSSTSAARIVAQADVGLQDNGRWNVSGHGTSVTLSGSGEFASWPPGMGKPGCDEVALLATPAPQPSFWMHVVASQGEFVDVGWCTPDIDVSGTTWMGWQAGKAWV
jgi:hypothetical protein